MKAFVIFALVLMSTSQIFADKECMCPESQRSQLQACELSPRIEPRSTSNSTYTTWQAINDCCTPKVMLALGFGCVIMGQSGKCMCPGISRSYLKQCELPLPLIPREVTNAPSKPWQAKENCCNGTFQRGNFMGCAYKSGKCMCPQRFRSNLTQCELPQPLIPREVNSASPPTWLGNEICCNGTFMRARYIGCVYKKDKRCHCSSRHRSKLQECELPLPVTPREVTNSSSTKWQAKDDCCNNKIYVNSAMNCAFISGKCMCPQHFRSYLKRCELPPQVTPEEEETGSRPARWQAKDDCCNGSNIRANGIGCNIRDRKCNCPSRYRSSIPECELPPALVPRAIKETPTIWKANDGCCNGKIIDSRFSGCYYKDS